MTAGVEEPNALVKVAARFPGHVAESMLQATTVSLVDGLAAELLNGLGKLDPDEDHAEYDKKYVHTDVLVVGGGVSGLAAAREAVRTGARVILIDDQPELGGSLLSGSTAPALQDTVEGKPALAWIADVEAELVSAAECTVLNRTTAFGSYDSNYFIAAQNRTDHLSGPAAPGVSRQRIWHIRAKQVVLAPGAHERPLVFENNDRPGIMLASAVRSYLNRYAVAAGSRVVISTTNDSAYALAADLKAAGVTVAAVVDARPQLSETAAAAGAAGIRVLIGAAVADTAGERTGRLAGVTVRSINDDGELTSGVEQLACDLLAVSGGWSPVVHLHSPAPGQAPLGRGTRRVRAGRRGQGPAGRGIRPRQLRTDGLPGRGHLRRRGSRHRRGLHLRRRTFRTWRAEGLRPRSASSGWSPARKAPPGSGTTTSWTSSVTSPSPT